MGHMRRVRATIQTLGIVTNLGGRCRRGKGQSSPLIQLWPAGPFWISSAQDSPKSRKTEIRTRDTLFLVPNPPPFKKGPLRALFKWPRRRGERTRSPLEMVHRIISLAYGQSLQTRQNCRQAILGASVASDPCKARTKNMP